MVTGRGTQELEMADGGFPYPPSGHVILRGLAGGYMAQFQLVSSCCFSLFCSPNT